MTSHKVKRGCAFDEKKVIENTNEYANFVISALVLSIERILIMQMEEMEKPYSLE